MRETSKSGESADRIAENATRGEDVSAHFTNKFQVVRPTHGVTVDLTPGILQQFDQLPAGVGVSRQEVIETTPIGASEEGRRRKPE